MNPLWLLGALFAAHRCLGKCVPDAHLNDCKVTGELPAPQIFLNVSEAQEGDWVTLRCALSSNFSVTTYFFCKDGEARSAHKAIPHNVAYEETFQISNQSAGQYSCGYKIKDHKNREMTSALSAPWKLTVLPGHRAEPSKPSDAGQTMSLYIWILRCVLVILLLVSAPIINCVLK